MREMWRKSLLVLAYLLLIIFCGNCAIAAEDLEEINVHNDSSQDSSSNLIRVNGGDKLYNIVPYQVSLQYSRRNIWRHFCGGSIITSQHVITAAHCMSKRQVQQISVVSGTLKWQIGGQRHQVLDKRVHPAFSQGPVIMNDIAIVKVWPVFDFSKGYIAIVPLSTSQYLGTRVPVRITGWGMTTASTHSIILSDELQALNYNTISNAECAMSGFRITRNELCALAAKGQGACLGDSGGPLVTLTPPQQLVGIVSYGTAHCAQGKPDVYTRISSFLPYINRVITTEMP